MAKIPVRRGATDALPGHCVPAANAFIGREEQVAAIRSLLLQHTRLLTLVGPPGVGKTRLALETAAALRHDFAHGVCVVPLADTADPAQVPAAIADALALPDLTATGVEGLASALADRHLLLVLDNFEHVLPAATVVASLLGACPRLVILATSRAPLRLSVEREFPVPPLSLPLERAAGAAVTAEAVSPSDAVRLFVQRARLVRPEFGVDQDNAAGVAALCRALDGLPLAIELAAARVRVLTPEAMAQHVAGRLALLARGARDAPARHQTLRAAIDWSHDLLTPDERRLFRRLAVFIAGFDVEAAVALWEPPADGDRAHLTVVDLLDGLAQQSLITPEPGTSRLSMLELVRTYALERLREAGEADDARWRHARHYAGLAAEAEPLLKSRHQPGWVRRLTREHPNLRAALAWLLERARNHRGTAGRDGQQPPAADAAAAAEWGLRLAGALWWFWHLSGHNSEGREWLSAFLDLPAAQAPTGHRARALYGAGFLAWSSRFWAWEPELPAVAARRQEESLAIFRALGDRRGEAYALWGLGLAQYGPDREIQARTLHTALAAFREAGDLWGVVKALEHLSNVYWNRGDPDEAQRVREEGIAVARELGEPQGLLSNLRQLGDAALRRKDLVTAREHFLESLAVLEASGLPSPRSLTHMAIGRLALEEGDVATAWARFDEGLRAAQELGSRTYSAEAVLGLAATASLAGDIDQALRLAGAAARYWWPSPTRRDRALADSLASETSAAAVAPETVARFTQSLERYQPWFVHARDAVGEPRARQLLLEGSRQPLEALLAVTDPPPRRGHRPPGQQPHSRRPALPGPAPSPLTPREAETAALIAQGLTNREIAARLTITERTVMRHVEHILARLGLRSRTQIAVWVLENAAVGRATEGSS